MNNSTLLLAAGVFGFTAIPATTQVLFSHLGKADPATEGWAVAANGTGTSSGPVTDDLGQGLDAWNVSDNSLDYPSSRSYGEVPTSEQISNAATRGWRLSTYLRVVAPATTPAGSSWVEYSDGITTFGMDFGSDADGDPIVVLATGWDNLQNRTLGPSFTLEGASGRYHRFDLYHDPYTGSADLLVDGVRRIRGYRGYIDLDEGPLQRVIWGSASSPGRGSANYNLIEWEIGPVAPVLDIRVSQVELCWNTVTNTGVWYQLQYCTTLEPNDWLPFTSNWFRGDGSRFCTSDTVLLGQPKRFYRVATTNSLQQP